MRILLQRVLEATVDVDGQTVGEIGHGLLIFHCVEDGDTAENAAYLAGKIARMRIFPDDNGKTNLATFSRFSNKGTSLPHPVGSIPGAAEPETNNGIDNMSQTSGIILLCTLLYSVL